MSGFSIAPEEAGSFVVVVMEVSRLGLVVRESGGGVAVREVGVEGVSSESESLEGSSGRVP